MTEPSQRQKCTKFNLRQIVDRNGFVDMNQLKRILEVMDISAVDVETGQTLLEYACRTSNVSLAKFCYRCGANLQAWTASGETVFNIATQNKSYRLMECLKLYGVKINSTDKNGRTGLHLAASNSDIDGICRLIEWGADVNCRDNDFKTPLHYAAMNGHEEAVMFLLELGADINSVDNKEYTAVAHAEANDHFKLMDRLVLLGGKGHRLHNNCNQSEGPRPKYGVDEAIERTEKTHLALGEVNITPLYMRKRSAVSRLGKYANTGLPRQPQTII